MEFNDPYDHDDSNLIYTPESIPTKITEEEFNEQFLNGCKCEDICTYESKCSCVLNSGTHYVSTLETQLDSIHDDYVISIKDCNKPAYECNAICQCHGKVCGNRLIQFGPRKHLKIISCDEHEVIPNKKIKNKLTPHKVSNKKTKGLGLITLNNISRGNFICDYAGEIITKREAIKRHQDNEHQMLMNYIFCINEHFGEISRSTYVDPSKFGNIGRYLNHSCEPNCEIIPVRVNNTIPKLCIFAKRDIGQHEELTFDYGERNINLFEISPEQNQVECLCQSARCRKYLPFVEYIV